MTRKIALALALAVALAACHGNTPPIPPGGGDGGSAKCAPGSAPDGKGGCKPI